MAPAEFLAGLLARDLRCDNNGQNCFYLDDDDDDRGFENRWDSWGRWVALILVVIFFLLMGYLFSVTRRRRQRGMAPMYGTGWIPGTGPKPPQGQWAQQNHGQNGGPSHYVAPPPPYMGNQATGTTFNSNDGYYGGHANQAGGAGIELQQPQSSYHPQRGGDDVYTAPAGPPPGKGDN
ncbi:hypothetical protein LZ554_008147 [Drepanopeziza brunnea f. sp. 'monogermtubi']|nr:hypothetical protein LZ554_008147 [Drepanopeziza brunnea f. sp. 'monogermtubi']